MKLKSLALAALAAVSVPSFAAINTQGNLGEAEYVLLVTNSKGSYAQDLGVTTDAIASMTSFSVAVNSTEWNKFIAFGGTNTQWGIIAVQPLGFGFEPGEINAWTTVNTNQALGSLTNESSNNTTQQIEIHFRTIDLAGSGGENVALATAVSADVNSAYTVPEVLSYANQFNVGNDFGVTASMVYFTSSSEESTAIVQSSVLGTVAHFDGNTVTITAVPEPSTYAMLAAGLAAVGFVARRRKAA